MTTMEDNMRVFALIDCNNFFVSCERIFRPDLEGKPVIVLSSNDGCAVARSNEAKALGITMAAPAFKYKQLIRDHNIQCFSANFELYGDISKRITDVLTTITPRIEVYSVDESFLDLTNLGITDYVAWGQAVRERIWQWVGVPVSIGIAPSKALAKLASERGKKVPELGGVCSFVGPGAQNEQKHMQAMPIEDIWGIGRKLGPKLRLEGLTTAYDFAQMLPRHAQKLIGIQGRQLVAELNGVSCWPLEQIGKVRKSIMSTRTFGEDTHEFTVLESAMASFAATAAFKLRRSGQLATKAGLFITTNRHKPNYQQWWRDVALPTPTADSGYLARQIVDTLATIYDPHTTYHRAGVLLHGFVPDSQLQTDLFNTVDVQHHDQSTVRMAAIDAINQRYGRRTLTFAAESLTASWKPRQQLKSPSYVSNWQELPRIKA